MKSQSIISPNAKASTSVKNWKRPPMKISMAMRLALERASAVQPPLRSIEGSRSNPRSTECKSAG